MQTTSAHEAVGEFRPAKRQTRSRLLAQADKLIRQADQAREKGDALNRLHRFGNKGGVQADDLHRKSSKLREQAQALRILADGAQS